MPLLSVFLPPREGLTLEYIFRPVHNILLQPLFPAVGLVASLKYPQQVQKYLLLISKNYIQLRAFSLALKGLLVLGIFYRLNRLLSRLVLNNFVADRTWDWQREIVLVTGGCSGLGEQMVRLFGERSIKVVALDVNPPKLPLPESASFYKMDVSSAKEVQETASKIRKDIGEPTVLVNNAGVTTEQLILDETEEQLKRIFDVNVLAHFKMIKEFLPYMIKRNHGHVVTIASMASYATFASNTSYSATKAAVLSLHEGLAQELRAKYHANQVRTTSVHPGMIRTPLAENVINSKHYNQFTLEPETVAEAVVSQVLKGESAQLILPARYAYSTTIRGWPSWFQESARNGGAHVVPGSKEA